MAGMARRLVTRILRVSHQEEVASDRLRDRGLVAISHIGFLRDPAHGEFDLPKISPLAQRLFGLLRPSRERSAGRHLPRKPSSQTPTMPPLGLAAESHSAATRSLCPAS